MLSNDVDYHGVTEYSKRRNNENDRKNYVVMRIRHAKKHIAWLELAEEFFSNIEVILEESRISEQNTAVQQQIFPELINEMFQKNVVNYYWRRR